MHHILEVWLCLGTNPVDQGWDKFVLCLKYLVLKLQALLENIPSLPVSSVTPECSSSH